MRAPAPASASASASPLTGSSIFRWASPSLYLALLLQSLWWFLRGDQPRTTSVAALAAILTGGILMSSLMRWRRPSSLTSGSGAGGSALLAELLAVACVVALPVLRGGTAITALPWLVMLAALFPLVLNRVASVFGLTVLVGLGIWLPLHSDGWSMPQAWPLLLSAVAVLAAGGMSWLLARSLDARQSALQQAHHSQRYFEAIARTTRNVFIITDAEFRIRFANHALQDLVGYSAAEIERLQLQPVLHAEDSAEHQRKLRYLRDTPFSSIVSRHRLRHRDGHWLWLEAHGYNLLHDDIISGLMFSIEDVTARMEAESRLRDEHALLQTVLDHNPALMYATDANACITLANRAFRTCFGLGPESPLRKQTIADLMQRQLPPAHAEAAAHFLQQDQAVIAGTLIDNGQELQGLWNSGPGQWFRLNRYALSGPGGDPGGLLCIARDITERKQYELQLKHQALHDPLTGLPNRRYLQQTAAAAIDNAQRQGNELAMLFCDLDFFKSVNDTHGHDFGDKCLTEITRRFQDQLGPSDFLARFGGNEFVVLTNASAEQARRKADALLQAISRQLVVDDAMVKIHASIGIALLEPTHRQPADLIRNADAALQQAKERGRNRVEMYDASSQHDALKRGQMDVALRFALEREELVPTFQPKVSSLNGQVKGFELLLRWHSSQYGTISPVEFIPIAETSGLVVPIGLWALEQACRQLKRWQDQHPDITIAVNVSMRQLLQPSFLYEVMGIIDRIGVRPGGIELELTETSVMANPLVTIDTLNRLKELGLRIALDDFGTGYSSLSYLQRLPINLLKIDKAFIRGLGNDASDTEIVRLILALAQALDLETVAEGVETREQMMELKKMGCYVVQGYVFSEALSAQEADELLGSGRQFVVA